MERISVLAITKNGIEMGLSLKNLFPDWQIFAPSKFSDNNEMINWYDDSTSIKIVDLAKTKNIPYQIRQLKPRIGGGRQMGNRDKNDKPGLYNRYCSPEPINTLQPSVETNCCGL